MSFPQSFYHIKLSIRDIENIEWVNKYVTITMLTAEFCGSETVFQGVLEDIVACWDLVISHHALRKEDED